jgi:hypothetical protein
MKGNESFIQQDPSGRELFPSALEQRGEWFSAADQDASTLRTDG